MARRKKVEYQFGKKDKNNKSFDEFMMSAQVLEPTMEVAGAIKRRAQEIGPESHDNEGVPYVHSFQVRPKPMGIVAGKYRNRRAAVELINTARHAPSVEFGIEDPQGGLRKGERVMLRAGLIMSPNQRAAK